MAWSDFGRPRFFEAEAGVEPTDPALLVGSFFFVRASAAGSEDLLRFLGLPLFLGPAAGSSDSSKSSESSDSSGSVILFLCTRGEVLRGGGISES